jgi:hypothetical protein
VSEQNDGLLEVSRDLGSKVEVKRNFKGEYGWEIRLAFDAETDDEQGMLEQLKRIDSRLRDTFLSGGGD